MNRLSCFPNNFKGIIFDVDGVLADTEPFHATAWKDVLSSYGLDISEDVFQEWIGKSDILIQQDLKSQFAKLKNVDVLAIKRNSIRAMILERLGPSGLREEIERFKGHKLGVCTSSPRSECKLILSQLNLLDIFDVVVTSEHVRNTKPSPEGYLLAAERMGILPQECIVLEDSPDGIKAASSAGMFVIGITTSFRDADLAGANLTFSTASEALIWIGETNIVQLQNS